MILQNLPALLWLLPIATFIVILYLLKMRRRDVRVPATFLWPAQVEEIRANSLFQKLRFSWLLVLQLLAIAFIIFALSRPQTMQRGLTGKVTVLVIDASASMGAKDVKPNRFEEARRAALAAVGSAQTGDRIALVEAGPVPRVISPLSNDPTKLRRALNGLHLSDSEADMGGALRLAASLVGNEESARIVLLSDGAFETVEDFSGGKASLLYQQIGTSAENVAVTGLGVAASPTGREAFVGLKNFGDGEQEVTVNLRADGKLIDSEKVKIAGKKTWGKTVPVPADANVLRAEITAPKDLLEADNHLVSLSQPGANLRVLLIGSGNLFLERALALDPRVTLDRAPELPAEGADGYDVVVFDGVEEQPVSARGVMTFAAAGGPSPVTVSGTIQQPSVDDVEENEILETIDFNSMYIGSAQQVKVKSSGQVLASSKGNPIIVLQEGPQRHLYVAFNPMQSDFPLQVGFPIFIANSLTFLGGEGSSKFLAVRAGTPFTVSAKTDATLKGPSGTFQLTSAGGSAVVREASQVGEYSLEAGEDSRTVYAYLRSDTESSIDPQQDLAVGSGEVRSTQAPARFADFWRPLLLVALLILTFEWWFFARRS